MRLMRICVRLCGGQQPPLKIIIFDWRLFSNAIPMHELLFNRHVITTEDVDACPLCSQVRESLMHLLFHCDFAKRCGRKLEFGLICNFNIAIIWQIIFSCLELHFPERRQTKRNILFGISNMLVHLARNNPIFKGETLILDSIVTYVKCLSWSRFVYGVGRCSG